MSEKHDARIKELEGCIALGKLATLAMIFALAAVLLAFLTETHWATKLVTCVTALWLAHGPSEQVQAHMSAVVKRE